MTPKRIISRFSCGAASAVATKLAIEKYGTVEIFYSDPGSEHPDNVRFRADCEKWFGQPVTVLRSDKYRDTWEVFERNRFLVSHRGAKCTTELKRKPGDAVRGFEPGEVEIYGYTSDEKHRVERWQKENFDRVIECPLIDRCLSKDDVLRIIAEAGIELPAMYRLGFRNNNCIACVKARDNINYWKRVRKFFPAQFLRMAGLEREFGFPINRRSVKGKKVEVYLDEIEPGDPKGADIPVTCGLFCQTAA